MPPDVVDERSDQVVRRRLVATPSAVREVLLHLRSDLTALGVATPDLARIEILLAELLNNIVEHAYAVDLEGQIELECQLRKGRLVVTAKDRGRPMPETGIPDPTLGLFDLDRQALPEGGFGWGLIRELAEELSYSRQGGANILRIGMHLAPTESAT